MGRPWSRPTLAERSRKSGDAEPQNAATSHHCWVADPPDQPGRYAGLLLQWRREHDQWLGLVVFVIPEPRGDRVRLVQRWLPADRLAPAFHGRPTSGTSGGGSP
jgi:hypothetical protein